MVLCCSEGNNKHRLHLLFDFYVYLFMVSVLRDKLSHEGGTYHIETSLLICSANQ